MRALNRRLATFRRLEMYEKLVTSYESPLQVSCLAPSLVSHDDAPSTREIPDEDGAKLEAHHEGREYGRLLHRPSEALLLVLHQVENRFLVDTQCTHRYQVG